MSDFSWPDVLDALARGENLDGPAAAGAMRAMMNGDATAGQIGAFLLALRTKGETIDELAALLSALCDFAVKVPIDGVVIDTCGTGGDRLGTVNISTMAALVVAGGGVRVAKHGNRAVSSACGSADVLEALGVAIELPPAGVVACIEEAGIGFMLAPAFHPAMRHVGPVRRELGVRTVFNMIAPLANPASVRRQTVGVSDPIVAEKLAQVLARRGAERAMVFHGGDGLDELSTTSVSRVWDVNPEISEFVLDSASLGLARASIGDLRGGSADENARVAEAVFTGASGPVRDMVLLNAAAAFIVAGAVSDFPDGIERARESIDSGAAARALERMRDVSQRSRA